MAVVPPVWKGPSVDAYADLVFLGGRVVTVDAEFSVASALAVTGGIISAVGRGKTSRRWSVPAPA